MGFTWDTVRRAALACGLGTLCATALAQSTELVSSSPGGGPGGGASVLPSASSDGRFVAFVSEATDLVPGDDNFAWDVFVRDRQTGTTELVSVDSAGNQANHDSHYARISADGRFVAFHTSASNLVPGDTNAHLDIFVHDRTTGATERVSVDSAGNEGDAASYFPSMSADGRFVVFWSYADDLVPNDTNEVADIFVHDRLTGATERQSVDSTGKQANGHSRLPGISADGRYVVFESEAVNLDSGDTNGTKDVFVRDRQGGLTARVSVSSAGEQSEDECGYPAISPDGRFVSFGSVAANLVPGDTNETSDLFVHDRVQGVTERISVDSSGNEGNDWTAGYGSFSADNRWVAFASLATNLVPGDSNGLQDAFVRDRWTGETHRVSVDSASGQANGGSSFPFQAGDGRWVFFGSQASDLVAGDTNGLGDVFFRDREVGTRYCFGDGSGTPCPCGNTGGEGEGCASSTGSGGVLGALGSASLSAGDLCLEAQQLLASQTALLFAGTDTVFGGAGLPFGDGLRCAGGAVVRLGTRAPDAAGWARWSGDLGARESWQPGDTRRFQVWYRDPTPSSPCGAGFNLTPAVEVLFGA